MIPEQNAQEARNCALGEELRGREGDLIYILLNCVDVFSIYIEYSIFNHFNIDLNKIYIKNKENKKGRQWILGQIESLAPTAYQLR